MGEIRGVECKIYLNVETTDAYADPDWSEWLCVRDVTLNLTFDETDATCRGGGGFRASAPTLTSIEVTGQAIKEKADAVFIAMELAARTKASVDVLVMDGPRASADADGWRFRGKFFNWTENQPFEDIVMIDFALKPARDANPPAAVAGPQPPV